jgi:hypothetical protein
LIAEVRAAVVRVSSQIKVRFARLKVTVDTSLMDCKYMPMDNSSRYTAVDLARLSGLPLRTVRYYVQEGLVDPPSGRGRGGHFSELHLSQLARVRLLQGAGLDIPAIRKHGDDLERILADRGVTLDVLSSPSPLWSLHALDALATLKAVPPTPGERGPEGDEVPVKGSIHIPLAPGIGLMVAPDIDIPSPKSLVELAFQVRRTFKMS